MQIESDEEFIAMLKARLDTHPYPNWTPEHEEGFIADLLQRQRLIRQTVSEKPVRRAEYQTADELDSYQARFFLWRIQHDDVGVWPTEPHRIFAFLRDAIAFGRYDERDRIAKALRADNAARLGPTASALIECVIQAETPE